MHFGDDASPSLGSSFDLVGKCASQCWTEWFDFMRGGRSVYVKLLASIVFKTTVCFLFTASICKPTGLKIISKEKVSAKSFFGA